MIRTALGLPLAYGRRLVCRLRGHRFEKQLPSPPGRAYCSRCRERVPLEGS